MKGDVNMDSNSLMVFDKKGNFLGFYVDGNNRLVSDEVGNVKFINEEDIGKITRVSLEGINLAFAKNAKVIDLFSPEKANNIFYG